MSARYSAPLSPPRRWAPLVDEVRDDHVHGASWLARRAADMLGSCAGETLAHVVAEQGGAAAILGPSSLDDLAELAWALVWTRPSMAAIANTVAAIWQRAVPAAQGSAESGEIAAAIERLRVEAMRQSEGWSSVAAELERHISPLLRGPVFTLSRSGSVEHALMTSIRTRATDIPLEVIIAESRPGGEGIALAQTLVAAGARVSLVTDSGVGVGMARARMLLLGADSVRGDGALVNKVGSYPAALVAADLGIPVYALCERLKITPLSYPLTLERAPGDDRAPGDNVAWTMENWLFDMTPARLITAIITEEGPLPLEDIARLAGQAEAALVALKDSVEQGRARLLKTGHPA